jgi:hypothetical protein
LGKSWTLSTEQKGKETYNGTHTQHFQWNFQVLVKPVPKLYSLVIVRAQPDHDPNGQAFQLAHGGHETLQVFVMNILV